VVFSLDESSPYPISMNSFRFFLMAALLAAAAVQAQTYTLTGKITDAVTAEPLPFCHVFVNRTTLGTTTDEKGNFTLRNIPDARTEIVITYIGYQTYTRITTFPDDQPVVLNVRLQPDAQQLSEVQVQTTRDKKWEDQLARFERLFFGRTPFKEKCMIKNSWALDFEETRTGGAVKLIARASQPLQIENYPLGYRVTYYLDQFESTNEEINLRGNIQFEPLRTFSDAEEKYWHDNRLKAYLGSTRHLLKAMVSNTHASQGFQIYYPKNSGQEATIRSGSFTANVDKTLSLYEQGNLVQPGIRKNEYRLIIPRQLEVHYTQQQASPIVYRDIFFPISWLESKGGIIELTAEGVVLNPEKLVLAGEMLNKRVAEMLPHDYQPEAALIPRVERVAQIKVNPLEERSYIHTDKPYYYPGERIWFKAYLNYRDRGRMDSLSYVLYVDWISSDKKIIQTVILPIEKGSTAGSLLLSEKMKPGTYYLRSYTNWMQNFPEEYATAKVIPVLDVYETPVADPTAEDTTKGPVQLSVFGAQPSYQPKSLISLDITLTDETGQPVAGDVSISVTDQQQVVSLASFTNQQNLLRYYPFPTGTAFSRTLGSLTFPIEYGLSLQGTYLKGSKKTKGAFAVVQGKMDNMTIVETNDLGSFWITGFQFNDTTEIGFRHINNKTGRSKLAFTPHQVPVVSTLPASKVPATVKATIPQRQDLYYKLGNDALMLDEVAVTGTRIELAKNLMGETDFKISSKEIMQASSTSLLDALAARVPGLMVMGDQIIFADAFRSTFGPPPSPLFIIDGYQTNSPGVLLRQINPALVEAIEVVKYGAAAMFGVRAAGGVIIIQTRQGGLNNQAAEFKSFNDQFFTKTKLIGYTSAARIPFTAPDYRNPEQNGVDFRSTIYWNPTVRIPKEGKATVEFFAATDETSYRVVVEGVSETGVPVRAASNLTIQRN
jgi:hypothetical protein